jgi:hypothetical protein
MGRAKTLFALWLVSIILLVTAPASAVTLEALLSGGRETPPNASSAVGTAGVEYDPTTGLFDLDVFVQGIALADLAAFDLRVGPIGVAGPVIVPIGTGGFVAVPDGIRLSATGLALPSANQQDLLSGNTYFNLQTVAFPAGEIRGQIILVRTPAPVLSALGLLVLAAGFVAAGWWLAPRVLR